MSRAIIVMVVMIVTIVCYLLTMEHNTSSGDCPTISRRLTVVLLLTVVPAGRLFWRGLKFSTSSSSLSMTTTSVETNYQSVSASLLERNLGG